MAARWTNVWVVMRREFLERVRKKSFLIMTFLTPLLFGAMMVLPGLLMMKGDKVSEIALVDKTGWAQGLLMAPAEKEPPAKAGAKAEPKATDGESGSGFEEPSDRTISKFGKFLPQPPGASLDELKGRLLNKDFDGVLVLEPAEGGELTAMFYGQNLGNPKLLAFMERSINRAAMRHRLEVKGLDPSLSAELQKTVSIDAVKVEKGGKTKSGSFIGEYMKALMFVMLLYMLIMMYGWALMRGVMEEKTGKVVEVLLSSVRPFELLLGKIVGIASVGLVQYALWFLLGFGVTLANPMNFTAKAGSAMMKPSELVLLVLFYLFGFVFYASIYAAMGAVCTTDQEAQQVNMPVVFCLIMPVMLMGLILQNPDATWVVVMGFIPFFAPTLTVMRASLVQVPLWQIAGSLLSLAVGTMVMAFVAGRIYRVGILMTGKRPSIPEILRWVREK